MENLDEDSLDLLGDDGDGITEICLFLDEDAKNNQTGSKLFNKSGCCVIILAFGTSIGLTIWGIIQFWA